MFALCTLGLGVVVLGFASWQPERSLALLSRLVETVLPNRLSESAEPFVVGFVVTLLALLRNEGGSVGTSVAQTVLERREQFHTLRLNEKLDSLNPALNQWLEQAQAFFFQQTGDLPTSRTMALEALQNLRNQQALSLAYFDVFWISAALSAGLVFLVLLMRPSVAEKGAHIAAE